MNVIVFKLMCISDFLLFDFLFFLCFFCILYVFCFYICISILLPFKVNLGWRLFTAPFLHGNEMHLLYNMSSLLWKGRILESHMGSSRFALLCLVFTGLSSAIEVFASLVLDRVFAYGGPLRTLSVGFSGVLFALKVILQSKQRGVSHVFSIPVPSEHLYWAELIIVSLIYPQASFLGHLCGILTGLLYTRGRLAEIIERIHQLIFTPRDRYPNLYRIKWNS